MKSNQKGKRCKEKTSTTESLLFVVDGLPSLFRLLLLLPPFFRFFTTFAGRRFTSSDCSATYRVSMGTRRERGGGRREGRRGSATADGIRGRKREGCLATEDGRRGIKEERHRMPADETDERCITEKASLPFCSVHPINNDNN